MGSAVTGARAGRAEGCAEAGSSALARRKRWQGSSAFQKGKSEEPPSTLKAPGGLSPCSQDLGARSMHWV